ncbi:ketopantoate reductase family protein [Zhongshania sp. BJYM1]|uniref:ketopantoate reductase family protein n=1 Tax=Zhongshania aquatica TaxID=2965069 RepID=UPI0022B5A029|nr:2-dehydropantoate 2-reductase [Marortus sp. BJYM1]
MRIVVIGAGCVGCYFGAKLQVSGNDVVYVARGKHLDEIKNNKLMVSHENFFFDDKVNAVSINQLLEGYHCSDFDLIIITLKSTTTAEVFDVIGSWAKKGLCPILSLQNGVENEDIISTVVGIERTIGGLVVKIGGSVTRPGAVVAQGDACVVLGPWPNINKNPIGTDITENIYNALVNSNIKISISNDIKKELWRKLLINNSVNPLSALTELDTRALTSEKTFSKLVYSIMEETALVAKYDDVVLSKRDIDEMYNLISGFDPIKTSMLIDYEKERELEIEAISGAVIRRGKRHNVATPMTELIKALLLAKISYSYK